MIPGSFKGLNSPLLFKSDKCLKFKELIIILNSMFMKEEGGISPLGICKKYFAGLLKG